MTIDTQKLRDLLTVLKDDECEGEAQYAAAQQIIAAAPALLDLIDAQAAEIARLRDALLRLEKGFQAGRDNASRMFEESGGLYHEGRKVAYDQAAADARAALSGESNG